MSLFTTPIFYYGYTVTVNDIFINFNEGVSELTATVRAGSYSFEKLSNAIATAMNEIGTQEYSVTTDRDNRFYTISAPSNFDLLFGTGSNAGLSIASVIGFNGGDKLGSNTYTSDVSAGSTYSPQFRPQDFIDFDDFEEFSQANVNESASGIVEVYSVGSRRFMEFNLRPITDNPIGGADRTNPNAVSEARNFLRYCITKGDLEIMRNINDRNTFSTLKLERSSTSSTGTGFRLNELYSQNLVGFYETGKLKFREVN